MLSTFNIQLWSPILLQLQSGGAFCLLQGSPNDGVKETAHPWGSTVPSGVTAEECSAERTTSEDTR